MAQRSFAYDHAAYIVPQAVNFGRLTGSGATGTMAAWADMLAKSVAIKPATAGTSNDTVTIFGVTGTTTRTLGITTLTSGQTAGTRVELTTGSNALAALDELRVVKGTDATGVIAVTGEVLIQPGANVTA